MASQYLKENILFKTKGKCVYLCIRGTVSSSYKEMKNFGGLRGRDHMVVGFTTTCAISAYNHQHCEFESHSWRGVLNTTLCHKVYQ